MLKKHVKNQRFSMSFKATIEFLLHLDSFRNVDLFNQGLYRLRLSIFHENGQEVREFLIVFASFP